MAKIDQAEFAWQLQPGAIQIVNCSRGEIREDGLHLRTDEHPYAFSAVLKLYDPAERSIPIVVSVDVSVTNGWIGIGLVNEKGDDWIEHKGQPEGRGTIELRAPVGQIASSLTFDNWSPDGPTTIIVHKVTISGLNQADYREHHPLFKKYPLWSGTIPAGFQVTYYGSLIRGTFNNGRVSDHDGPWTQHAPLLDEDLFEWISLLEAIAAAQKKFVMVELGAGFGRWLVSAAAIVRTYHPDIAMRLIGLEAESAHFAMMRQHFIDNDLDPDEYQLIRAAVAGEDGEVSFQEGLSTEQWGHSILETEAAAIDSLNRGFGIARVPALSIRTVLEDVPRVDLIDMDIQGMEGEAIRGSIDALCSKVKRLHIGTHSHGVEHEIIDVLARNGWELSHGYPCLSKTATPYGPVDFQDGVQAWVNLNL